MTMIFLITITPFSGCCRHWDKLLVWEPTLETVISNDLPIAWMNFGLGVHMQHIVRFRETKGATTWVCTTHTIERSVD
jgi:hypothetical protein